LRKTKKKPGGLRIASPENEAALSFEEKDIPYR
jgi:hypothetical protein